MNTYRRIFIMALFSALFICICSACNTVQGVGKDIKRGGEALEKVAK
jgi:predicted small secreted protein